MADEKSKIYDCPVVWFAVLEAARKNCDGTLIEKALANLHRLGVRVEYELGARDGNE